MVFSAEVKVVGKDKTSGINKATGQEKKFCSINITQEDGRIIGTLSVAEEVYDMLEKEKQYNLKFTDRAGSKGIYYWVIAATPIN